MLKAGKRSLANASSMGSILLSKTDFHFRNEAFHIMTLPIAAYVLLQKATIFISWLGGCMLVFNQQFAEVCYVNYYTMLKRALCPQIIPSKKCASPGFSLSGKCVSCHY